MSDAWDGDYEYDLDYDHLECDEFKVDFRLPRAAKAPPATALTVPADVVEAWARNYIERWMAANLGKIVEKATLLILKKRLEDWVHEATDQTIEQMLEGFFAGKRQLTDGHGFEKGSQQALGEAVLAYTKKHLSASTDRYGNKRARLDELVQDVLIKPLGGDLKKMLAEVRQEQKEKAEAFVAKMMAASLKQITP